MLHRSVGLWRFPLSSSSDRLTPPMYKSGQTVPHWVDLLHSPACMSSPPALDCFGLDLHLPNAMVGKVGFEDVRSIFDCGTHCSSLLSPRSSLTSRTLRIYTVA